MVFAWRWCGVVPNTAKISMIIVYGLLEVGVFPALQLRYKVLLDDSDQSLATRVYRYSTPDQVFLGSSW